jgi:hypothetical protein
MISQLTGKKRRSAQLRALRFMAIDHKQRPDGSAMVLRSDLGGTRGDNAPPTIKRAQPNWN